MPRTLPAAMEADILLTDTAPAWLVELELTAALRYSTGGEISWNGLTWYANGISVEFSAANVPTIGFPNHANAGSALMLNNDLRDVRCNIYEWRAGAAYKYYSGYLSPAGTHYRFTYFVADSTRSERAVAPRRRMVYPVFTHMPVPGTEIRQGTSIIKVGY